MPGNLEHNEKRSAFEFYRQQPEISLEQHVRTKRAELGTAVTSLQRIYLDVRFWIMLRDVVLGRCQEEVFKDLLIFLRGAVANGRAICPISEAVLMELLKQSNPVTRDATARLIDDLSLGVALVPFDERICQELCHFAFEKHGVENLLPLDNLVWTKQAYVLGQAHPYNTGLSATDELAMQKSICDEMWTTSLMEMLSDAVPPASEYDWDSLARRLNASSAENRENVKSFAQTFRAEFEGGFSLFKNQFVEMLKQAAERSDMPFAPMSSTESEAKRFAKFSRAIPTLHIASSCHAAVRWDQKRNLTGNDLFDFHHAEAALAYCDVFLTERALASMLSQRHLGLDTYECRVFSAPRLALEWLQDNECSQ